MVGLQLLAVAEDDAADTPAAAVLERHDLGPLAQLRARPSRGERERVAGPARVDRGLRGDLEREAQRRRERRLELPGTARQQARDGEAELLAVGKRPLERLSLITVASQQQCSVGAQTRRRP
jgi:hypothetical protein